MQSQAVIPKQVSVFHEAVRSESKGWKSIWTWAHRPKGQKSQVADRFEKGSGWTYRRYVERRGGRGHRWAL